MKEKGSERETGIYIIIIVFIFNNIYYNINILYFYVFFIR